MSVRKSDYETALADYSNRHRIVSLLGSYRQYLEMIPSMRRPAESVITIPLPVARVKNLRTLYGVEELSPSSSNEVTPIPCDIAILMCDPEWKIKVGVEILVFIHRPGEDFSDLLRRWRKCQVYLNKEYEWIMPVTEAHMFSDIAEEVHPLFVVFPQTPERIRKGLRGANLPYVEYTPETPTEETRLCPPPLERGN